MEVVLSTRVFLQCQSGHREIHFQLESDFFKCIPSTENKGGECLFIEERRKWEGVVLNKISLAGNESS